MLLNLLPVTVTALIYCTSSHWSSGKYCCNVAGLRVLSAHDVHTLKASLDQVAIKVDNDPDVFQSFYQFAFKYCLTVRSDAGVCPVTQHFVLALPVCVVLCCADMLAHAARHTRHEAVRHPEYMCCNGMCMIDRFCLVRHAEALQQMWVFVTGAKAEDHRHRDLHSDADHSDD